MAFSKKLEQRGFNVLGDSQKTDIPFTGVDIVTTRGCIKKRGPLLALESERPPKIDDP